MRGKLYAWSNLAFHFWKHVLTRWWLRPFRRGRELAHFRAQVQPEGYLPLAAADREHFPDFMRCIHCGLCSLACPALLAAPAAAWQETWTFVAGPSRSLDRASLAVLNAAPCARCPECTAVCPTGVPIDRLAGMVTALAAVAAQPAA
jgi:succinate dehydrogenase/fumarate reductase-like Fe-S protein